MEIQAQQGISNWDSASLNSSLVGTLVGITDPHGCGFAPSAFAIQQWR